MIERFEELTRDLSEKEKQLLPLIAKGINSKIGKENIITNQKMCDALNKRDDIDFKIEPERMRKMIQALHLSGLLPNLVAGLGYYIAQDLEDLNSYYRSLTQRISAIQMKADQVANDIRLFKTNNNG